MKAGYETIVFGSRLDDLESKLGFIADAGFQGVEFSQRHEMLRAYDHQTQRSHPVTLSELAQLLQKHNLTFLGMAGGTLEERIRFCLSVPDAFHYDTIPERFYRPLYLYIDSDDIDHVELAAQHGFRLAIHPHVFMKCERVTAARHLVHPERDHVFFMPDTAHAYIAGDDPAEEIRALGIEKLIAVHLKDWDAAYGRSSHRYAKGFVPLGDGEVPLKQVLAALREIGYQGWVIAEQDYARQSPLQSVHQAATWFAENGLLAQAPKPIATSLETLGIATNPQSDSADETAAFAKATLRAEDQPLPDCYAILAQALWRRYHSCHVSIWACGPARNDICLLHAYPPDLQSPTDPRVLDKNRAVLGIAVETLAVEVFPLADVKAKYPDRKLYWADVAVQTGAKEGVAIPVPNRFNPHHIRFVVGLLQSEIGLCDWLEEAETISSNVSRAADFSLDNACTHAAGTVNGIADASTSLADFLTKLTGLIQRALDCQGVSLFLTNRTSERLEVRATTGITWRKDIPENARFYLPSDTDNPTTRAWTEKRTILLAHAQQPQWNALPHPPRSSESGPGINPHNDNILLMPIISIAKNDQGKQRSETLGVIRCRNKQQPSGELGTTIHRLFTDDDAAILDTICQTATPHIQLRQSHEQSIRTVALMTHELNMPINSLRAAIDLLRYRLEKDIPDYARKLFDYFERIFSLSDINVRVVNNATLYGMGKDQLKLKQEPTWLKGKVIAPAKSQVRFLLRERGFDTEGITYSDFAEIPKLYVDRNQFQQVCFNLLSNAIKYAYADPNRFRVYIQSAAEDQYYRISFRDWGPGIPEDHAPFIFEEGVRGPKALAEYVGGLGLGLWIVRRVVEAHGGYVEVTHFYEPTEITLYLPLSLRSSPIKRTK